MSQKLFKISRFGNFTAKNIQGKNELSISKNIISTNNSLSRQFMSFSEEKKYYLKETRPIQGIANILRDWTYNMREKR